MGDCGTVRALEEEPPGHVLRSVVSCQVGEAGRFPKGTTTGPCSREDLQTSLSPEEVPSAGRLGEAVSTGHL